MNRLKAPVHGVIGGRGGLQQLKITQHDLQQIVKLVRDTARQLAHRPHLLRTPKAFLQNVIFRGVNDAANRAVQDAVIQKQRRPLHEHRSHLAVRAPQFRFVGRYRAVNPFRPFLCNLCGDPLA